jgi:hypothetical protein
LGILERERALLDETTDPEARTRALCSDVTERPRIPLHEPLLDARVVAALLGLKPTTVLEWRRTGAPPDRKRQGANRCESRRRVRGPYPERACGRDAQLFERPSRGGY